MRNSLHPAIRWTIVAIVLIAMVLPLGGAMELFSGNRPANLGARDGRLAPCATTPNCVCSQSDGNDATHHVVPIGIAGSAADAWSALLAVVRHTDRAAIVEEKPGYIHAEFTSRWMGFVDDVEFLLNEKAMVIEVRSASRLGVSDFGVNRKRVESIRAAWSAYLAGLTPAGRPLS